MAKKPQPREKSRTKNHPHSVATRKPRSAGSASPASAPTTRTGRAPEPDPRERTIRYWPLLAIGVFLLAGGALLSQRFESKTFTDDLFRKLPGDSYLVGASTLDALNPDTIKQLSGSLNAYAAPTSEVLNALVQSGISREQIKKALDDQFAFAASSRGGLFVFTLNGGGAYDELAGSLGNQLDNRQTFSENGIDFITGTVRGTQRPIVAGRAGQQLYLSSSQEMVRAAVAESNGFTNADGFADVAGRLPAGDGYLFLRSETVRAQSGIDVPLVGVSWTDAGESLELTVENADSGTVSQNLPKTDGKLLLPASGDGAVTGSVSGTNLSRYLAVLQEQRSESDLPKVLAFQNGVSSLNRSLGKDIDRDFISKASGRFVYARYSIETTNAYAGLAEFPSAESAQATYNKFSALAKEKLTIPVRKQVVRVLPDGTQSREIVAEGRGPLAFSDFSVDGRSGQAVTLPNIGPVHILLENKYLIIASTPDGVSKMLKVTAVPGQDVAGTGELAVRAKVSEAYTLLRDPDLLSDWVLATRPARGTFSLEKATGVLSGSVNFGRQ